MYLVLAVIQCVARLIYNELGADILIVIARYYVTILIVRNVRFPADWLSQSAEKHRRGSVSPLFYSHRDDQHRSFDECDCVRKRMICYS